MAASIALRGRRTPIWASRPARISKSKLFAKPDAAKLLARELSAPGYVPKVLAIGTNTDPYQPLEKKMRIMRGILEVLHEFRHPVGIVTKSALIQRDLDILAPMAELGLARVALSVTTLDRKLARAMEPRAATPPRRLETIRACIRRAFRSGVMFAPVIPALNDERDGKVLAAAAEAGADNRRLRAAAPAAGDQGSVSRMAGGERAGSRQARDVAGALTCAAARITTASGTPACAARGLTREMIAQRFHLAAKRLGLNKDRNRWRQIFRHPPESGDQLAL